MTTYEAVEKTYGNVNWNARAEDGSYPCRNNDCYSLELVAMSVSSYLDLLSEGTGTAFNPSIDNSATINAVLQKVKAKQNASGIDLFNPASKADEGRVAAILYEYYYISSSKTDKSSGLAYILGGLGIMAILLLSKN